MHGRAAERSTIDRLLAHARAGHSGALVIRGEAGIGKTALLDYAARAAGAGVLGDAASDGAAPGKPAPSDMAALRVIRGAGVRSEAELPFAGLHLLLGSALDRGFALPQPQRDALGAAFGRRRAVAGPADRFLVGVAVLSLLVELAEDGPLACLVDDAQWLDRASAEALLFAARRLDAEGIVFIFAARDHDVPFWAQGLPELRLGALDPASAAALLMEHGGAELPAEARELILAEAQGNPLGLIELRAAYLSAPAAVWPGPGALALTDRLQQAFDGQVDRLPEPTQTLLLAAAADDSGDLGVVLEAARALGMEAADLGPAEQADLVHVVDGAVRFRHPLVRAAVYQGAMVSRRLAVHRALADAFFLPADADRRAWHLAAATTEPDERVAAELERTAAKAVARSGYAAATAAYERAVALSAEPAAQGRRLTLAAKAAAEIGEFDRAHSLAVRAAAQTTDPALLARLAGVRAMADSAQGRLPTAHGLLVEGAAQLDGRDSLEATRMLMDALHIAWFLGDPALIADTADRLQVVGRSVAQPYVPLVQLALWSVAQAVEQPTDGLPPLADLVAAARRSRAGDPDDLALIASVSLVTGRNADGRELMMVLTADARAQGRIGWLPTLLTCLAQALVFDGRHCDAQAAASEALRIAHDTGQMQWAIEANAILAYLAAVDGDQVRCRRLVDAALAEPATHATAAGTPWAAWGLGLLDLGRGRLDTALVHLEAISQGAMRYHTSALQSVPDLVEVAVHLGQPQRVAEPLARFSRWARHANTPRTDALVERCHALLDTDGDPERHYLAALKLHDQSFQQARTQLLYGAWLRRARRKADARTQLRAAVDHLDRINATPWAERARAELNATGLATPRPGWTGLPRLTPQELQVARLAAQGLSNRDIAAQLFLSPRTVGYHLYKAYPKLGITSRSELDSAMLTSESEATDV
jgi:DNA-binding CsgD family transcriptional regulator/tetratricopeptide (TPR) repeat protein